MYYYIVNPAAGRGQIKNLQDKLRSRLDQLGIRGEWAKTTGPGNATRMAQSALAAGHTTIVAVGGDDTLNEVINGLDQDTAVVGVIPIGSTNRIAAQLGIVTWEQACEALAARRLTSYRLLAAGQKFFLSSLSLGFETDLDKNLDSPAAGPSSRLKEFIFSLTQARKFGTLHCKIQVDNTFSVECDLFSLTLTNQKFLNPLLKDQLVISLTDHPSHGLKLSSFVWQTLRYRHISPLENTATTRFLANRVIIETDPPAGIMVDGKITSRTPIAIRLTDRKIRFITEKIVADFKQAIAN